MPQGMNTSGFLAGTIIERPSSIDDYLDVVEPIVTGIAATFGRQCEVVLHDFRDPEHSIVAIQGQVTERHVGGSVSQLGLSLIAQGNAAQAQYNYFTRTPGGRVLKSTTIPLRDPGGRVFGALCINFDITDLRLLGGVLGELTGTAAEPRPVSFVDDIGQVIRALIDEGELAVGRSLDRMTKQDRLVILRVLDQHGVFALRRSVPQVAEYLRISRATVYSYLEEIRSARVADPPPSQGPEPPQAQPCEEDGRSE